MRDDNAMSNYFICNRDIVKFRSGFRVKQSFPKLLLKPWLSQYWNWITYDSEKKLKENI